jgi:hypothetical protein
LIGFHVADAFANTVALCFGHGRKDREDELRNSVSGHITTQIDHMQTDIVLLELPEYIERIQGGAEHAVELRGDRRVARLTMDGLNR